jgi:hypothetical protein
LLNVAWHQLETILSLSLDVARHQLETILSLSHDVARHQLETILLLSLDVARHQIENNPFFVAQCCATPIRNNPIVVAQCHLTSRNRIVIVRANRPLMPMHVGLCLPDRRSMSSRKEVLRTGHLDGDRLLDSDNPSQLLSSEKVQDQASFFSGSAHNCLSPSLLYTFIYFIYFYMYTFICILLYTFTFYIERRVRRLRRLQVFLLQDRWRLLRIWDDLLGAGTNFTNLRPLVKKCFALVILKKKRRRCKETHICKTELDIISVIDLYENFPFT